MDCWWRVLVTSGCYGSLICSLSHSVYARRTINYTYNSNKINRGINKRWNVFEITPEADALIFATAFNPSTDDEINLHAYFMKWLEFLWCIRNVNRVVKSHDYTRNVCLINEITLAAVPHHVLTIDWTGKYSRTIITRLFDDKIFPNFNIKAEYSNRPTQHLYQIKKINFHTSSALMFVVPTKI